MKLIDLLHLGRARVIGAWAGDGVIVDPGPESCLPTLLAELGEWRPRAILLTHIHLDHAGATGSLVRQWPDVEVYVHERGARHLIDPSKLLASASRLYGEEMERLWGEVLPVPEAAVRVLRGGEQILGGEFEVAYAPGHASHHVVYRHGETVFVGDVAGVRVAPGLPTIPPTPPPDIDVPAWHGSVAQLRRWEPRRLAMTHFGVSEEVGEQLDELEARLDAWTELARRGDRASFIAGVERALEPAAADGETLAAYRQAAPWDQLFLGLERFVLKQGEG